MLADLTTPDLDRAGDGGRLPYLDAVAAFLLIGAIGGFGTLQVWVLAISGAAIAFSIARRDGSEPAAVDHAATWLKVAFVVVLCSASFDNREHHVDFLHPGAAHLGGFCLIAAGLDLRRRSMAALGHHFSIKVVVREDHRLVEDGPYAIVRHPNYTGLVLVMLGTAIVLESPLALVAVLAVWMPALLARIRHEEAALERHFGAAWAAYVRRTWRLLPRVY
jgi:protein-S-isoprenylcysteine O-methyltransferase Ste14